MCVVLFGSNSLKMSVLFYMNYDKKDVLFGRISRKVSVFDVNTDKKWVVVLLSINSLKLSELFDINCVKKYVILFGCNPQKVPELI